MEAGCAHLFPVSGDVARKRSREAGQGASGALSFLAALLFQAQACFSTSILHVLTYGPDENGLLVKRAGSAESPGLCAWWACLHACNRGIGPCFGIAVDLLLTGFANLDLSCAARQVGTILQVAFQQGTRLFFNMRFPKLPGFRLSLPMKQPQKRVLS